MKTLVTCLFVSAGVLAGAGNALASEALAKKYNCLACHAADKKLIGPSYAEIAAKYKGDAGAEAKLIAKVKNGNAGTARFRCRPMRPCRTQMSRLWRNGCCPPRSRLELRHRTGMG